MPPKKGGKKKGGGGGNKQKAGGGGGGGADSLPLGDLSLQDNGNGSAPKPASASGLSWTAELGLPEAPEGQEPVYVYSPAGQKVTQYQLDRVPPVEIDITNVDKADIPEVLCCPISEEVLRDPVVAADGVTYEREAIVEWLKTNNKSPMSDKVLADKILIPNKLLRDVLMVLYGKDRGKENAEAPAAAAA